MSPPRDPQPERSSDADRIWKEGENLIESIEHRVREERDFDQTRLFEDLAVRLRSISGSQVTTIARTRSDGRGGIFVECLGRSGFDVVRAGDPGTEFSQTIRWVIDKDSGREQCRTVQRLAHDHCVFIEQGFDAAVPLGLRQPIAELQNALTSLIVPWLLRSDCVSLDQLATETENLFAGSTPSASYHQIAAAVASLGGVHRATLVRCQGGVHRVVGSSASSKIDRDARAVRSIERLMNDVSRRDAYQREFAIQELQIVDVQGADGVKIAAMVLESFADTFNPGEDRGSNQATVKLATSLPSISRAIELATQREDHAASLSHRLRSNMNLRGALAMVAIALTALGILCWIPIPFSIPVQGMVEAVGVASVYAPDQGLIAEVYVKDGQKVVEGAPLVQLSSPTLDLAEQDTQSRLEAAQTKLTSAMASKRTGDSLGSAETEVLKSEIEGLKQQIEIISKQRDRLLIRSPIAGVVDQWEARRSMVGRPVAHGHHLMDLVDESEGWQVKLSVPDHEIGYLDRSTSPADPWRTCSFRVVSSPTVVHTGKIIEISSASMFNEQGDRVVEVTVDIDDESSDALRQGAGVMARVPCEKRSLAFVLFRGFTEWWRTQVWI
jgi:Barrel-sandwich domain of CusB or HlyD membrane-fusion